MEIVPGGKTDTSAPEAIDERAVQQAEEMLSKLERDYAALEQRKNVSSGAATGGIAGWLIHKRIARNEAQATTILLVIAAIAACIALFAWLQQPTRDNSPPPPRPTARQT